MSPRVVVGGLNMSELIDRQTVLELLKNAPLIYRGPVESLPCIVPTVVANICGGVLQGSTSDYLVSVITLDYDGAEAGEDGVVLVDGDYAYRGPTWHNVEPEFIREVLGAQP